MNFSKRNITYVFLFITIVIYISILTIKSYLFQFSYVLTSHILIIVLYEFTKRKKINLEINSLIFNYSLISLIFQLLIIGFGILSYSIFIVLLFLFLVIILKSIDKVFVQNWKEYNWKARIINSLVVFHVFPLLFLYLFFLNNYFTTPKSVEYISTNELHYIDSQTGKEMSIDSLAQKTADSIIKSKKKE